MGCQPRQLLARRRAAGPVALETRDEIGVGHAASTDGTPGRHHSCRTLTRGNYVRLRGWDTFAHGNADTRLLAMSVIFDWPSTNARTYRSIGARNACQA